MKTELTDVSETRKTLTFEIPSEVVDAEINRIAKDYSRQARVPGFRPGKVPAGVVKQRYRSQILHDVMHDLIPRAVDEALQERGLEPVDTPDIRDVALNEGQPLTFTAAIETVPPFDPGDLSSITVTKRVTAIDEAAVDKMLERLRERAAKYETIETRPVTDGDTLTVDITRQDPRQPDIEPEKHEDVSIELGSSANPPGFDAQLVGMNRGETKTFDIHFPASYPVPEMADTTLTYTTTVKEIRHKTLPELDDEFAKDLGEFDSLAALRDRVRQDLEAEAAEASTRQVRNDLLKQLGERVTFELPASMVDREIDRRTEEFVRQLMQQNIDPRQAGIDWSQFREAQRDPARAAVASALVLDAIARRENVTVSPEDVDREIEQFAARANRTPAALRAQLEKEGGVGRLTAGLRREKAVDLALTHVRMVTDESCQATGD